MRNPVEADLNSFNFKDDPIFKDEWTDEDRKDAAQLAGPVLIVGGSGFIGAKFFFNLLKIRPDVFVASSHVERSWRLLRAPSVLVASRLRTVDVTDPQAVRQLIQAVRPRTVFNLAAYGGYERQAVIDRIHSVNYVGALNLIHALSEQGCDAFVQAGSSSEYGTNSAAPAEEGDLVPNSDYAASKAATSLLIKYYGKTRHFPCAHLRLYSVYGPWEERDRLVATVVAQGSVGKFPPFAEREISRDFVFIDDCLRAFVRAALTICKAEPGFSVNIATGTRTSLADVARIAQKLFQIEAEPSFGSMKNRKWDLSNWYGNAGLAEQKLGWKARITFEDGLRLTRDWEQVAGEIVRVGILPRRQRMISAIIACYRDQRAIPIMYERLVEMFSAAGVDFELIFVNDASPEGDEAEIRALCQRDSRVIGITHSRNFGSQSAFLSGMEIATGDAVVLMDGDLQDPPEVIPEFMEKWEAGYKIVYGVRTKRAAPFHMKIFYKLFYRLFRRLSDIEIPVDAGDFSLIDRAAVVHLLRLPEKDHFVRGLRAWIGFRQTGVEYLRPERKFGKSTNSLLKNIWWAKKAIFSFSTKPLNYIQALGLILFALSWVLIAMVFIAYFIHPDRNPRGANMTIILILGLGGVQVFAISVLGDYIGKILEEVKNRPRFIRAGIFRGNEAIDTQSGMGDFISRQRSIHG